MPGQELDEFASLIGSVVGGKYRIERSIGRGGMGAVFLATNTAIGKRVALKFLSREASQDRGAAQRFQREAEAASLVESAHIVQIFDSGRTDDERPFLVMELLTGEDLRARLHREGRLPESTAVRIACQVLRALISAHRGGIVHRDLKPDNIFLCARDDDPEFVKVVDFGISKLSRASKLDTLTARGTVLGTVFYMSPEQAQSLPDIDGRTDLFSLGAILFEMLTGRAPYVGPTYEAVLVSICTKDAPSVRRLAPEISEAVAEVVARALARDRSDRFQTAEEFLSALTMALPIADSATVPRTPITTSRQPTRASKSRSYGTFVLSAIAMLTGFAVAAYWIASTRAARRELSALEQEQAPKLAKPAEPAVEVAKTPAPSAQSSSEPAAPITPVKQVRRAETAKPPKPAPESLELGTAKAFKPKPKLEKTSPAPRSSAGVAGSLELSTREP